MYIVGFIITAICVGIFTDEDKLDDGMIPVYIIFWPITIFIYVLFVIIAIPIFFGVLLKKVSKIKWN